MNKDKSKKNNEKSTRADKASKILSANKVKTGVRAGGCRTCGLVASLS